MVFTPKHSSTISKMVLNALDGLRHGFDNVEATTNIERAVLIRQRDGLFGRKTVTSSRGIVINVATGCLIYEPLSHVTLVGIRLLGEFGGGNMAGFSNGLVQTKFLTDVGERRTKGCAKISQDFT